MTGRRREGSRPTSERQAGTRIAIDIDGQFRPDLSGIHHYLDGLLGGLAETASEHELTAFAPLAASPEAVRARARDGVFAWTHSEAVRIDVAGATGGFRRRLTESGESRSARAARAVDERIRRRTLPRRYRGTSAHYDLLHVPNAECPAYEQARARCLVATIFDLTPRLTAWAHAPESVTEWEAYFAFAQKRCDGVITISEAAADDIVEHLAIPRERIHVTPLAPRAGTHRVEDAGRIARALAPFGLSRARFVLYAGTLEPRKNVPQLVRAFARARAAGGSRLADVKLVLAGGSWATHTRELTDLAASLGINEQLVLTGYVDNEAMNALMSACAVFAYLSQHEGFGLPPLEAMTCGAPVVVSEASSLPEVVGDAGIMVPPADVEAVADALLRLLDDEVENARWRIAALARAARFSWQRTAEATLRTYASVGGG